MFESTARIESATSEPMADRLMAAMKALDESLQQVTTLADALCGSPPREVQDKTGAQKTPPAFLDLVAQASSEAIAIASQIQDDVRRIRNRIYG